MLEFKRKKRRAAGACCRCANMSVAVIELIIGIDTLKIKAQPFFFEKKNCTNCLRKKSKIVLVHFCQTVKGNKCNNIIK